jgi:hypothetical protein
MPPKTKRPVEDAPILDGLVAAGPADNAPPSGEAAEAVPDVQAPAWTPFLLGQLGDDELYEGRPTWEGLRRLTELHLGRVVEAVTVIAESPSKTNGFVAACVHNLTIQTFGGDLCRYSGAADCSALNCLAPYSNYPTATAESRAKGRAYKSALQLRNVYTSDEIGDIGFAQPGQDGKIDKTQEQVIDLLCCRCDIDGRKLIALSEQKYRSVRDMSYDAAQKCVKMLNEIFAKKREVPAGVSGYDPSWRDS